MSSSGISWATYKSEPRSRQITTPASYHSVGYRKVIYFPTSPNWCLQRHTTWWNTNPRKLSAQNQTSFPLTMSVISFWCCICSTQYTRTLTLNDTTSTQRVYVIKTDLMSLDNVHHVLLILIAVQLHAVRPRVALELRLRLRPWQYTHTHTHPFNGPCPGLPRWAGTRKVKPIWILLKQETVSGSGFSWDIMQVCTSLQADNHASAPALSFLQAGCPFCRSSNSVKALKA